MSSMEHAAMEAVTTDRRERQAQFLEDDASQGKRLVRPAREPGLYMELIFPDGSAREDAVPIKLSSNLQNAYQEAERRWISGLHADAVGYQIQDEFGGPKVELHMGPLQSHRQ